MYICRAYQKCKVSKIYMGKPHTQQIAVMDKIHIPISEAVSEEKQPLKWSIHVGGKDYDWWSFLQAVNEKIDDLTSSQDKKLGYFFCKAKDGRSEKDDK